MTVAIVDYAAGNVRSLQAALARIGASSRVTRDPDDVASATLAILPGVGSAASAMRMLTSTGLDAALRDRVTNNRRLLGICLGMQLALEQTEEDGGVECLGLIPGRCVRLRSGRVPRMGWACVQPWGQAFYFAHSFAALVDDPLAVSEGVAAAMVAGSFTGVQFHPEKSGRAGELFLQRCLSAG